METKKEVKTILVDYKCPECEDGYLRPTERVLTTHPPKYPHDCNAPECDNTEVFTKTYPYTTYE